MRGRRRGIGWPRGLAAGEVERTLRVPSNRRSFAHPITPELLGDGLQGNSGLKTYTALRLSTLYRRRYVGGSATLEL